MNNSEQCVPAKAVQIDGTTPAQGDDIEVTLKGKVTRVDGEQIYFKATEANGQPIEATADEETEEGDEPGDGMPSEESLRAKAAAADEQP